MMKIKSFMLLAVTAMVAFAFTACSDDDTKVEERYNSEFALVDNQVAQAKKHDKAILLVAFGSTWDNAFKAFDSTIDAYKTAFPDCDVYLSFSSDICINRAHIGENKNEKGEIVKRDYYSPNYWLHALGKAQYKQITVQSLQVIPGEEFAAVVACVKKFANNGYMFDARLDDDYLSKVEIHLGLPLLNNPDEDVPAVAAELNKIAGAQAAKGVVAFMGHGNPDSYDTFKANIRYNQLEEALQKLNKNYFVGCVDQPENFKPFVYDRMAAAGITSGNMYLYPLMSIAGDHAHNDMAGDDDEAWDEESQEFELNEEGEAEETSWKCYFAHKGFKVTDDNCTLKGLIEFPGIRQIWINHTKDAELLEDAYHSMNPE